MKSIKYTILVISALALFCTSGLLPAATISSAERIPGKSYPAADTVSLNDSLAVENNVKAADTLSVNGPTEPGDTVSSTGAVSKEKPEPKPSNWKRGGQTALNFSQISLSNWAGGGQNSASFNSYFNLFKNYKSPNGKITWENTLDLGYGVINQENRKTIKSDDKIDFSTKFGLRASDTWSYSSLISFKTQMAPGYKRPTDTTKISDFMAPAYLNISVGMNHVFDEYITFYLSPVAGRITYVLDEGLSESGAFGVEPGESRRNEFGGFIRAQFRATLMENITLNSRLELFSNYLDKPLNLKVNSDTRINMQINQYISANLVLQMVYDENVRIKIDDSTTLGPRLQIKQVFGLGFSYKF